MIRRRRRRRRNDHHCSSASFSSWSTTSKSNYGTAKLRSHCGLQLLAGWYSPISCHSSTFATKITVDDPETEEEFNKVLLELNQKEVDNVLARVSLCLPEKIEEILKSVQQAEESQEGMRRVNIRERFWKEIRRIRWTRINFQRETESSPAPSLGQSSHLDNGASGNDSCPTDSDISTSPRIESNNDRFDRDTLSESPSSDRNGSSHIGDAHNSSKSGMGEKGHTRDNPTDSALDYAIALLRTLNKDDWQKFDYVEIQPNVDERESRIRDEESREQDLVKLDEFADIMSLLNSNLGNLTTKDLNTMMAYMALSSHLESSDVVEILFQAITQMKQEGGNCTPNSLSYEIVLLACIQRLNAEHSALMLANDLVGNPHLLTHSSLGIIFQICEKRKKFTLAKKLYESMTGSNDFHPPSRVYRLYASLLLQENYLDEIVELLKDCLRDNHRAIHRNVDGLLMFVLRRMVLGDKGRERQPDFLCKVLKVIRSNNAYHPSVHVIQQLIYVSRRGVKNNNTQMQNVRDAFILLSRNYPYYMPDSKLVAAGLDCAEFFSAPRMAADIIGRLFRAFLQPGEGHDHRMGMSSRRHNDVDEKFGSQLQNRHDNLSFGNILRAMKLFATHGDARAALQMLDQIVHYHTEFPFETRQMVYRYTVKICADRGNAVAAENVLKAMMENGLMPSDQDFAAVLHSFRHHPSLDQAVAFVEGLENEQTSTVSPGPQCYNELISLFAKKKQYSKAILWYKRMQSFSFKPQPATIISLIVSLHRNGDPQDVKNLLVKIIEDKDVEITREVGLLVLQLFFKQEQLAIPLQGGDLQKIREEMRSRSELASSREVAAWLIEVTRCLRLADLEDKRKPVAVLNEKEIAMRRSKAWGDVIKALLARPESK